MNTRANQTLKEAENPILSLEDLSIDEEQGQVENVNNKKCPICKRDQKNVLLHIKKNSQCKAQISEEQLQVLKDQSKAVRQKKVRISVAKCMRRAREKNEEMVKEDQNKRKQKSRAHEKLMKTAKQKHEDHNNIWNIEDGTCPSCKKKMKNVLLHLSKSRECKATVSPQVMKRLVDISEKVKKIKRQEAYNKMKESKNQRTLIMQEINKSIKEEKDKGHEVKFETMKEMQNRWKAKSRKLFRERDSKAVKKYQKDATAKWRDKKKREDPKLYKARQQMWRLQRQEINEKKDLMKVPKLLLDNYHRLDPHFDSESDDEGPQKGLSIRKQIQILNDKTLKKKEKMDKMWTIMYPPLEVCLRHFTCHKIVKDKCKLKHLPLDEQVMMDFEDELEEREWTDLRRGITVNENENSPFPYIQEFWYHGVEITWEEAQEIRNSKRREALWDKFKKEGRVKEWVSSTEPLKEIDPEKHSCSWCTTEDSKDEEMEAATPKKDL